MKLHFFDFYSSREAWAYFALSAPALVLEVVFAVGLAMNPSGVIASVGGEMAVLVAIVPWAVLVVAVFAFLRFRPSTLVATLGFSFFLSAITGSQAGFLGTQGGFGLSAGLVVIGVFLALVGFNYSRGASLRAGRDLRAESRGPLGFQLLGICLEFSLPLLFTLAVLAFVSFFVGAANGEAHVLPEPLSTIATLYLNTRAGLASIVIVAAGITIWAAREFLEPVILYYTLTYEDAVEQALGEVDDVRKAIRGAGSVKWFVPLVVTIIVAGLIFVLSTYFLGKDAALSGLKTLLSLKSPSPTPNETNLMVRADRLEAQIQYILNALARMLWG